MIHTTTSHLGAPAAAFTHNICRLYLVAGSEEDVLLGIKLALDNGMKVAFHGSGVRAIGHIHTRLQLLPCNGTRACMHGNGP